MAKSKALILAAIPAMLLCGCTKQCEFQDFVDEVKAIETSQNKLKFERIALTGKYSLDGKEYKLDEKLAGTEEEVSEEVQFAFDMMYLNHVSNYIVKEDKEATYFIGKGFKMEKENLLMEWDEFGMCTKLEGEDEGVSFDLKAKYEYKVK